MDFELTGILHYSPTPTKNSTKDEEEKWWAVLECDPEIGKYYRHLFYLQTYRTQKITRAAWKEHICILRNEKPKRNIENWGYYEGAELHYKITAGVETNGMYYWLPVVSPCLINIRRFFGLSDIPDPPFHLTIGWNKNETYIR